MSFFNWFFGATKKTSHAGGLQDKNRPAVRGRPVTMPVDQTRPMAGSKNELDPAQRSIERKARRNAHREQLYTVVREAMTHAGVLTSSYKFKVLSLDQRGDQFLVMMDIEPALNAQPVKLMDIEAAVIQSAKTRFEILVTSVYWRGNGAITALQHAPATVTEPLAAVAISPKPMRSRYDPIQDDEVAAFKTALANGTTNPVSKTDASGKTRSGAHSYTLLTGFEDTEMPDSAVMPALSTTQYGELN